MMIPTELLVCRMDDMLDNPGRAPVGTVAAEAAADMELCPAGDPMHSVVSVRWGVQDGRMFYTSEPVAGLELAFEVHGPNQGMRATQATIPGG